MVSINFYRPMILRQNNSGLFVYENSSKRMIFIMIYQCMKQIPNKHPYRIRFHSLLVIIILLLILVISQIGKLLFQVYFFYFLEVFRKNLTVNEKLMY